MQFQGSRDQATRLPRQSQAFFLLLLGTLFFLAWIIFEPFVIFIIVGIFVAVLALPIDSFFERMFPSRVAAIITMVTLFIIISAPFVALGFALFEDTKTVLEDIRSGEVEDTINAGLDLIYPDQNSTERNDTIDTLWSSLEPRVDGALSGLANAATSFVTDFFVALVVILFVVYYLLVDGASLVQYLRRALPLPPLQVDFLLHEAQQGLHAVFVGQILTSLIQGALGGVGFLIAGLPGAVLWAGVMAVLSLLPVVGAFIVWIPAAIYLFLQGSLWQTVFLVVWGLVVVSQVDNFVRPRLIGNRANIHPFFVLAGVLGGVAAFGFIGLFLGPLVVGVLISVLKVWETDYLDQQVQVKPEPTPPITPTKNAEPDTP